MGSIRIGQIINQVHKDFHPLVQKAITHNTRSQSSLNSIQIARKSSKELKDLAQQLLLQSKQLESEEKNSLASSEASVSHCPNNPLFQDSQDPYDGYNLDTVIKIILDSTSHYSEQFLVPVTIHPQYQSLCMNSTRT